jgi:dipeptidyl aminopeptidase/acylaminoacyl peptidase
MCARKRVLGAAIAITAALGSASHLQAQTSSRKSPLTIEQLIGIKHPSDPAWSPDNKRVVFTRDRADIRNLYVASADGRGAPVALTAFPEGGVTDAFWSEDGETVYFVDETDLWKVPASGGEAKPAWSKPDTGSGFVPHLTVSVLRSCETTAPKKKPARKAATSSFAGSPTGLSPPSPTTT